MTRSRLFSSLPRAVPCLFAPLILLLLGGCGGTRPPISPVPFEEFAASIQELQEQADLLLEFNETWALARFIDETAMMDVKQRAETIEELYLQTLVEDPYSTEPFEAPLFLAASRFREAVYQLNSAYAAYALLLSDLASHSPLSGDRVEALAADINEDARLAIKLSRSAVDTSRGPALFSTIAVAALRSVVRKAHHEALKEALLANQNGFDTYAFEMAMAVEIAATNLWQEYDQRAIRLRNTLTSDSTSVTDVTRKRVESLVELNRSFLDRLAALRTLNTAYEALPAAHRDLVSALEEHPKPSAAIDAIRSEVHRLKRLYESLSDDRSLSLADSEDDSVN